MLGFGFMAGLIVGMFTTFVILVILIGGTKEWAKSITEN